MCSYILTITDKSPKKFRFTLTGRLKNFDLNLSSVIFASAANAASTNGSLTGDDAFTIRYESSTLGSAIINAAQTSVSVSDALTGIYQEGNNKKYWKQYRTHRVGFVWCEELYHWHTVTARSILYSSAGSRFDSWKIQGNHYQCRS